MISVLALSLQFTLAQAAVPAPLLAIEKKYQREGQLRAELDQVTENASFKTVKRGTGRIWIKLPGLVRWETLTPDPSTWVTDGKTYWYYTPPFDAGEPGQLVEKPARAVKSELATVLLAGRFSTSKNLTITSAGRNQFRIVPRKGTSGSVKQAVVEIDPAATTIRRIEILHTDGNRAEIRLKAVAFGEAAETTAQTFVFQAPANTERVKD